MNHSFRLIRRVKMGNTCGTCCCTLEPMSSVIHPTWPCPVCPLRLRQQQQAPDDDDSADSADSAAPRVPNLVTRANKFDGRMCDECWKCQAPTVAHVACLVSHLYLEGTHVFSQIGSQHAHCPAVLQAEALDVVSRMKLRRDPSQKKNVPAVSCTVAELQALWQKWHQGLHVHVSD